MVFNFGWAPQLFGASREGGKRRHAGIDLGTGGKKGVPVGCPIAGFKVHSVSYRKGYGNTVDLISEDGSKLMRFAHLENLPTHLPIGASLQQGDWLGDVGSSGGNYATHLHFEYRTLENGAFKPVNPFNNPYHSFSRNDFEWSTQLALKSRSFIQNNMSFADSQVALSAAYPQQTAIEQIQNLKFYNNGKLASSSLNESAQDQAYMMNVWGLEKSFNQPTLFERYMPSFLGGWSAQQLQLAHQQRSLEEEVFKGIKRQEMLEAGISNQEIDLVRQYVDEQIKTQGANYHLGMSSIPIDFDAVFDNPQRAAAVRTYFDNHAKTQEALGAKVSAPNDPIDLSFLNNIQRNS